jgi:low temperature requirement protein LtrA
MGGRQPWLTPPRLRTVSGEGADRRATWLEPFFDLVFVVAITELAHQLVVDHSAAGFLTFAGLFVPVYVAWQGYMAYADRFDTDDLLFRVAYLVAMLAIAAMAVLIDDVAHGVHSAGFAVAYVVLRSLMLGLYWRAWRAVPEARPLIRFYSIGYSIGAAIWLASLAVHTPARYAMWAIAQVLELSLPPFTTRIHRRIRTSASHLPERWALFTLIVIGESVVAVAVATAGTNWRTESVAAAVLGFAAVAAVWWLYFDRQAAVALRGGTRAVVIYSYAHLPLLIGLAAVGAGVRLLIERASQPHLGLGSSVALVGGVIVFILSLIGMRTVTIGGPHRVGVSLKLATVAVLLALLLAQGVLPPVVLAAGVAGVLVALVVAERTLIPSSAPAPDQAPWTHAAQNRSIREQRRC